MIEQKLIVGRYINMTNVNSADQAMRKASTSKPGSFVTVPIQACYIQESTGIFTKTSDVKDESGPKPHRNFWWLPWLSGAISEVPMQGVDVLTGPMSGCWMVMYRKGSERTVYVGHVGTDLDRPYETEEVKKTWKQFAADNPGDVIAGFNPLRSWPDPLPAQKDGEGKAIVYGLLTTAQVLYGVFTYQQTDPGMVRIAGIKEFTSADVGTLQRL